MEIKKKTFRSVKFVLGFWDTDDQILSKAIRNSFTQ